jgi:small subunit ribosomal protein S18
METATENRTYPTRGDDDRKFSPKGGKFKKRVCKLCQEKTDDLDYKKTDLLVKFVSNKGKILPRRLSGSCAKHQRVVAKTIKKSRASGFMPYNAK